MIVLPSRGRPASLQQFFDVSRPSVRGVVMLDDDDAHNYKDVTIPGNWLVTIGPRVGYVAMLNEALRRYPEEPFYAYGGDDVRCTTPAWDMRLSESAGQWSIAYGDDGINGEATCGLPFLGGSLVRAVGWLAYPALSHLFCDTVWRNIGRAIGALRYHHDIKTEHLHWSTGKMAMDRTAKERKTQGDSSAYQDFITRHLSSTVARCTA